MVVIVCLDQKNGMKFNHRRQSMDRTIISDIYDMLLDSPLAMSENSQSLFKSYEGVIEIEENPDLDTMFYFLESSAMDDLLVDEIVVYRFDKVYPADEYFPIDLKKYVLMDVSEFAGYSHDKISKEVYSRII